MFFAIDPHDGVPIYDQIVRQVTFAVARGAVRPGEAIPSVRELAGRLAVNPNTVARAYRDLQTSGVLAPVRGLGMEIAAGAAKGCRERRGQWIRQRLGSALGEALASGLGADEIRGWVDDELRRRSKGGAA
ncbi:MAG TPA: GntR family transcriptional regulator [Planctomycetia bacterium]|nr:GntR family transcriptional regulator [Planctomycetia bacterium]